MKKKNPSIEANLSAAKNAAHQMMAEWVRWTGVKDPAVKHDCLVKYEAAFTICKVFIENYLKHIYPNQNLPPKVAQDIRELVRDMESIQRVTHGQLQKIQRDIDQLSNDIAA